MRNGISEFDKNLQKLGIEQNVNMEDAMRRMEEKQGICLDICMEEEEYI